MAGNETALPESVHPFSFADLKKLAGVYSVDAAMKKKVEFSSHTGNLALMRRFVRKFLDSYPFSEKERTLMVLGVDEACTNIIRHAYHLQPDQLIALSMEGKSDCVCLRLRDYGRQSPAEEMQGRAHDLIKPGGLGMHLIRSAFDKVDYILKPRGTELVLTKHLG
jgi:anti-sigma regulatory factor (Ser/Thr protein kinase)